MPHRVWGHLGITYADVKKLMGDFPKAHHPSVKPANSIECQASIEVTVTLETSIGSLVLRGLRACVEEKKMEIDVLIGRPIMERLGFTVDGVGRGK
ncbi:hypothetical protein DYB37_009194 [Aphanomyces astaci]|uniref:Uncharacterized protein n=1 Tax=Aphanomyces astaci TaxID=112090 RepID=A0A3R6ZHB8_APHAT|nr:hypothetical protein DYB35_004171 [Aphanomyces astaci]RHZ14561.1 hypothetical protein DYB37_009194 [Aphanomyces astaci]